MQHLTYLVVAAEAVEAGEPFDKIRLALFDRARSHAQKSDGNGSFDAEKWEEQRHTPKAHFRNTVVVLKELMRLGWVERHDLPSTPSSARAHPDLRLNLTPAGYDWVGLIARDPLDGFDALATALIGAHPQFEGFLRAIGARPNSTTTHLTIPLMRPDETAPPNNADYLSRYVSHLVERVSSDDLGWSAAPELIEGAVRDYVSRAEVRDAQRAGATEAKKVVSRRRLATLCEEAAVRTAFTAAGCPLDYVSHELLRRWTRFLGLANFSYYVPGPSALRLWKTADVIGSGTTTRFRRTVGDEARRSAMEAVPAIWRAAEHLTSQEVFLPVWRIRAAVCWEQRISDNEFDAALTSAVRGEIPGLGFRVHLDGASGGRTPRSTKPLILATASGRRVYHVMRVYTTDRNEEGSP
ncbi:hypothetical protein [Streptomyces sp. NPDC049906]|uniref:hypothetical protein n=1 Tax=Streptomyces sp. NPDC049906 TaxID=3155656 RepID=UPI003429468D